MRSQALRNASCEVLLQELERMEAALLYERRVKFEMQDTFQIALKTQQEVHLRDVTELECVLQHLRTQNQEMSAKLAELAASEADDHAECRCSAIGSGSTEDGRSDSEAPSSGSGSLVVRSGIASEVLSDMLCSSVVSPFVGELLPSGEVATPAQEFLIGTPDIRPDDFECVH